MSSLAAGALVFFSSAAVLVLEILAARLLAPYVGDTLETYTGIIGVVLAGISLGTWLGGRLADRYDPRTLLGPIVLLGGALALCVLPAVLLVGPLMAGAGPVGSVTLSFVGFLPSAAVLSAVSPTIVKLQLADLEETGSVVGRLSALGTAGAIFGTFVTGFLLVATLPTRPIVLGVGVLTVALGLLLTVRLRGSGTAPINTGSAIAIAVVGAGLSLLLGSPCQYVSTYFCAAVVVDEERPSGRTLWLDRLRHSYVDLDDPTHLEFTYAQIMGDVLTTLAPEGEPIAALHIGGGGFTLPRYINATRPGSTNVVYEVDGGLVELARNELGLRTGPDLRVEVDDARTGVAAQPAGRYDLVIGDAFGGQAVPWHLTTAEFTRQIKRTLAPGGTYAINLIDYPPLGFARAETATLQAVFSNVAVIATPERIDRREGGNFVLVGSDEPIDAEAIAALNAERGDDDEVATGARVAEFVGDAPVLTDDYAPVDQLLTPLDI